MPNPLLSQPSKALKRLSEFMLGTAGLTVGAVLVIGAFFGVAELAGPALQSAQLAAVVSATLVDLTNQDRASNQLQTLTVSPLLVSAAQAKANDMASKSYFAHVSPQGLTSWYWFQQAGYSFIYAGENLAVDFTDSSQVNQAWLDSPTHRANILNGHFTQIGIATAQGTYEGHPTIFVVQMFGSPADNPADATVAQTSILPAIPTEMAFATNTLEIASTTHVLGATATATIHAKPIVVSRASTTSPETTSVATTVSSATSAPLNTTLPAAPHYAPAWAVFVSSPQALLRAIYFILSGILLVALLIRTEFELRSHHARHVAAVAGLMVLMIVLFFIADHFIFVQPILGAAQQVSGN